MEAQATVATMRADGNKSASPVEAKTARYHSAWGSQALRRLVRRLRLLLQRLAQQARVLQLQNTAASLAFLSLLAIVPIFSIVLSVLAALPMFDSLRDSLQEFLARQILLPAISDTLLEYMNRFATQARRLSLAGAALFFATAIGCLLTIDRTLNRIWDAARPRPLPQRLTLYWALLTIAPVVLGASITINGLFVGQWLRGGDYETARRFWYASLSWLASGGSLLLLYRLVPNTSVRWREAGIGALVATILIGVLRDALGSYLAGFSTYTIIYGAFSVVPLLLVWLFMLWLIILAGALLASNLRYWALDSAPEPVSTPARDFADALAIIRTLAEQAPQGNGHGLAASTWRAAFADDPGRAERAARLAARCGYVLRMVRADVDVNGDDDPAWAEYWSLTRPAAQLELQGLFQAVWGTPLPDLPMPGLELPLDRWVVLASAANDTASLPEEPPLA